ncbi:molecular chaperone Hsp33 [Mariprofundus micogutta]|uniref:Molecular chaperone Hsp33 n=1 Tax=Mariprofundus micogutta TaxID=1921010 RepID=A0A1L8CLM6_9PROT|nr:Hsp33 family molecular chaperone HslO [Mariprofundus micogutta]GAV19813.1 molecular chaperone Hsp33 [Mariprofundus micogutta]
MSGLNNNCDTLTRFLLPEAQTRGALIRGSHIIQESNRIHGLNGLLAGLFGQTLLASILLLSISKGGIRQVLQLDATTQAPVKRILTEARSGAVRGFLNWQEEEPLLRFEQDDHIGSWMGRPVRLSTVRDLGVGQPYISTIENDSDFLADHLLHYLNQSVQIRADIILLGDCALMIEAMPGCDEEHWFKAVEAMAKIPDDVLATADSATILAYFDELRCKAVGTDSYTYQCDCSVEKMAAATSSIPEDQLQELADEDGNITVSCQYCDKHYSLNPETGSETSR